MPDLRLDPVAVLCDAPTLLRSALEHTLHDEGYVIGAATHRGIDLVEQAAHLQPQLVVASLAQAGALGVRLLDAVRVVAPRSTVFAIVAIDAWRPVALSAGADRAFTEGDVRGLTLAARRLRAAADPIGV